MPSLEWFAGVFEGEGSISIHGAGRRGYSILSVQVVMTDEQIVRAFADRWSNAIRTTDRRPGVWKKAYGWQLRGGTASGFLRELEPFVFSARVREKIELAIEYDSQRRQGSRDPDYKARCFAFRSRMSALNARGVDVPKRLALPRGES